MRERSTIQVRSETDCRNCRIQAQVRCISLPYVTSANRTRHLRSFCHDPNSSPAFREKCLEGCVRCLRSVHVTEAPIGPYFVAFPNLKEALTSNTPIKTDARSCTILPNFVGCVSSSSCLISRLLKLYVAFGSWYIMERIIFLWS
jgi:hypothetical protein